MNLIMIEKETGRIKFDKFTLFPRMELDDFFAGVDKDEIVSFSRNSNIELYLKPQKSKNSFFIVRLFFECDNKRLKYVLLSAQDDNSIPSWDTWSRENELERKVRNDVWLQEELGVPPYKFTWGMLESVFDEKAASSYIWITLL